MSYAFKISVIISAYIIVSIMGAYFIKLMLRRYEEDVETSSLKETFLFKKETFTKEKKEKIKGTIVCQIYCKVQ